MIDKLRFAIDNTNNPRLLKVLADMTTLPDDVQESLLNLIESGAFEDKESVGNE